MPLGAEDPAAKARDVLRAVQKAWRLWRTGLNLDEIIEAVEDVPQFALDYAGPGRDTVKRAIMISFTGEDPDRLPFVLPFGDTPPLDSFVERNHDADYRRLGVATEFAFDFDWRMGRQVLGVFPPTAQVRERIGATKPQIVISQAWPPALSGRETDDLWDFDSRLGDYDPDVNAVTLYSRSIRRCAHSQGFTNLHLATLVCLHEVGHWWVHRYPLPGHEQPWPTASYMAASSHVQEALAQWICRRCVRDRPRLVATMDELATRQSPAYSLYKELTDVDPAAVAESVAELRRSPDLARDYAAWRSRLLQLNKRRGHGQAGHEST